MILGHTEKIKSRSILCGAEGYITFLIKLPMKMNHMGFAWTMLRKIFPNDVVMKVKGMKQFTNMEGVAFDVPEEMSVDFEATMKKDRFYGKNFEIELAVTLPECSEGGKMGYVGSQGTTHTQNFTSNSQRSSAHSSSFADRRGKTRKDVFMGNMPFGIDVNDIKDFLRSNQIDPETDIDIRITMDRDTGKQKGFAFISSYDEDKYNSILKLTGMRFKDRNIRCDDANNKPNR